MHMPWRPHLETAKRVLCYLKHSTGEGILLSSTSDRQLKAFCDSDWSSCLMTRQSITGYFTVLGHSVLSRKTNKQAIVPLNKVSFYGINYLWNLLAIVYLLRNLGVSLPYLANAVCDNQIALHIASNPVFHERTKHIDLDYHFVQEKLRFCCYIPNIFCITSNCRHFHKAIGEPPILVSCLQVRCSKYRHSRAWGGIRNWVKHCRLDKPTFVFISTLYAAITHSVT